MASTSVRSKGSRESFARGLAAAAGERVCEVGSWPLGGGGRGGTGGDGVVAIGRSSKRRVLGVSLGERALVVAEVTWNGGGAGGPKVVKAAEYRYPAGMTLDDGAALG